MESYEHETKQVIEEFLADKISFFECIAALDAALASIMPLLTGEKTDNVRALMLANNETVIKEMERRGKSTPLFKPRQGAHPSF